ncbi:MAG: ABC transporter permease [candidate division Zixibacteria bacterium]|nr:ABC transporter permease [candidate division Zixibacteria bacterium]MBU1470826.1 ABC transporter permease [candidate division Zixibacteria bacterium]MBU2625754.1 ABC transporter permease [candidate division Zixibacteria bacterium]
MTNRLKPVIKKELRQISRDRRTLGILLFIPAFMLVMFGYALNFDVRDISLAVCDEDKTSSSREFIESFLHSEYFTLNYSVNDPRELDELLDNGDALVAIVVPIGFSESILAGRTSSVQVLVDGTNPTSASTAVGYATAIVQSYSNKIITHSLMRVGRSGVAAPIDYRPRIWFNPELKSAKFLIPGLIGFILMVTAVVSTSLSIVREKERGTMEQLTVSPLNPIELILGKTIPYIVISLVATVAILIVGQVLFDVTVKGSYALLLLVTLIYLTACLGLGLLISSISDSQQVAFQIAVMATMLPTFLLSGFVFPIRNMPIVVQAVTYIVPARFFMVALRAIVLKGVGITAFWDQLLYLLAFALLTIGLSSLRMRGTLLRSKILKQPKKRGKDLT